LDCEELSDDDVADTLPDVNRGWHLDAHHVPPQAGTRVISIKAQPSSLQAVIKAAIREVTGDALFVTAYPSAVTVTDYYCDILKKCAENLNNPNLRDRFEKDRKFAEIISRVVGFSLSIMSQHLICLQLAVRLSNLRCTLKKAAASEVKGFYQLIPGDDCKERVKHLIETTEYIYLRNSISHSGSHEVSSH
jgi:hypothetical protein